MTAALPAPELPHPYKLVAMGDVDGTNHEARRMAENGLEKGGADKTVIWAKSQSAGRGRRGRAWASPEGNLYFSILLRPQQPANAVMQLGFVMANAIADTVASILPTDTNVKTKWPNDVLVGGKKISGILLEGESKTDGTFDWLAIGVGINIASHPDVADGEVSATSLSAQGGNASIMEILSAVVKNFADGFQQWNKLGFAPVRQAWMGRAASVGGLVRVRLADETINGTFNTLDENGALVLEMDDGSERLITAGDVFLPTGQDS